MRNKLFTILFLLATTLNLRAVTLQPNVPAGGDADTLIAAINAAPNGVATTIELTAGTFIWSKTVKIPNTKVIWLKGSGQTPGAVGTSTVLDCRDTSGTHGFPASAATALLIVDPYLGTTGTPSDSSKVTRISGIDFKAGPRCDATTTTNCNNMTIHVGTTQGQDNDSQHKAFHFDGTDQTKEGKIVWQDCFIEDGILNSDVIYQTVTGVFSNLNCTGVHFYPWDRYWHYLDPATGNTLKDWSDGSFAAPIVWGSDDWLIIEDSTFAGQSGGTGIAICDSYYGGRSVWRHNHFMNGLTLATHGTESGGARGRGVLAIDCYENTFHGLTGQNGLVVDMRGGVIRFHDNHLLNWNTPQIIQHTYRTYLNLQGFGMPDGTNPLDDGNMAAGAGDSAVAATGTAAAMTTGRTMVASPAPVPAWSPVNKWKGYMLVNPALIAADRGPAGNHLYADIIESSDGSSVTVRQVFGTGTNITFGAGDTFEIRKGGYALDQVGRSGGNMTGGVTTPFFPGGFNNQVLNPSYAWSNYSDTGTTPKTMAFTDGGELFSIVLGTTCFLNAPPNPDFPLSTAYTTYTYPHPLASLGPAINSVAAASFTVDGTDDCSAGTNCFTFTTSGFSTPPTITITPVGATPSNVSISNPSPVAGQARIHGTAHLANPTVYVYSISATNGTQTATPQTFSLTVQSAGTNSAPVTSVSVPGGSSFLTTDTVTVNATASDADGNSTLTQIQILDGATVLKTCASTGVTSCSYASTFSAGSHSLTSKASDATATTQSSPVVITVNNPLATPTPPARLIVTP